MKKTNPFDPMTFGTETTKRFAARRFCVEGTKQMLERECKKKLIGSGVQKLATMGAAKAGSKLASRAMTSVVKCGGNPLLIVADAVEIGLEYKTGSKALARGSSLAIYAGVGAATGGPVGAAVGVALWGVGQAISGLCSKLF